jgi:hypothetical protein
VLTTTLRDGTVVLAKMYKGEPSAMTYSNRTQAETAAVKNGGEVIQRGRPFYVAYIQHDPAPAACVHGIALNSTCRQCFEQNGNAWRPARIVAAVNGEAVRDNVDRARERATQAWEHDRAHLSRCVAALQEVARIAAAARTEPTKSALGALGMIERAALAAVKE